MGIGLNDTALSPPAGMKRLNSFLLLENMEGL